MNDIIWLVTVIIYTILITCWLWVPSWWAYIFVITVIYTIFLLDWIGEPMKETFNTHVPYSWIGDNLAQCNPFSWDNRQNPKFVPFNPRLTTSNDLITYQGVGRLPLSYEDYATLPAEQSMFLYKHHQCRPECCHQSNVSCSHGCVCRQKPINQPIPVVSAVSPAS